MDPEAAAPSRDYVPPPHQARVDAVQAAIRAEGPGPLDGFATVGGLSDDGDVRLRVEQGTDLRWDSIVMDDPVQETWNVSHHPDLDYKVTTAGGAYTAAELQQVYLDLVLDTFEETGTTPTQADQEILTLWQSVLDRMRADLFSVATEVEWVGKYQLVKRQKERAGLEWTDPRLAAIDLPDSPACKMPTDPGDDPARLAPRRPAVLPQRPRTEAAAVPAPRPALAAPGSPCRRSGSSRRSRPAATTSSPRRPSTRARPASA